MLIIWDKVREAAKLICNHTSEDSIFILGIDVGISYEDGKYSMVGWIFSLWKLCKLEANKIENNISYQGQYDDTEMALYSKKFRYYNPLAEGYIKGIYRSYRIIKVKVKLHVVRTTNQYKKS